MLTWILVSFGITFAITHGKIFEELRKTAADKHEILDGLVRCPMCLGFWVGMALSLAWKSVTGCFFRS